MNFKGLQFVLTQRTIVITEAQVISIYEISNYADIRLRFPQPFAFLHLHVRGSSFSAYIPRSNTLNVLILASILFEKVRKVPIATSNWILYAIIPVLFPKWTVNSSASDHGSLKFIMIVHITEFFRHI